MRPVALTALAALLCCACGEEPSLTDAGVGPGVDAGNGGDAAVDDDAGAADAADLEPEDCFPLAQNDNLEPTSAYAGVRAEGGSTCDLDNVLSMDQTYAGLAFDGSQAVSLSGHAVTACVIADLGKRCQLDSHIGFGYAVRGGTDTCGDTGGDQCAVAASCGAMPGTSVMLFAADQLFDIRFVVAVGNCGEGVSFGSLDPMNVFTETSDMTSVRYLIACRPFVDCAADDGNVEVDALYLTYRE